MHIDTAPRPAHDIRPSRDGGTYPRPQLVRGSHHALDVVCGFAYDDEDRGRTEHWEVHPEAFARTIQLPFAPESAASGIGDTGYHPVVWYQIDLDEAALDAAGRVRQGDTILLHFGAVDYRADVWVDGQHVLSHEGGQTAFSADITRALRPDTATHSVVVRAQDDPLDVTVPRGKQDWQEEPHSIWYHRTTGIWQPVWLEAVPALHVADLAWEADVPDGSVTLSVRLSRRPTAPVSLAVRLDLDGELLAEHRVRVLDQDVRVTVDLPRQANGQQYEEILWSPEHPTLVDAIVELVEQPDGSPGDTVASYVGLRSVAVAHGVFLLNDRPYYLRSVLEQGFWPDSHLAAPNAEALRAEVQVIKDLGFNSARVHQKAEDPRFLFWADKLGLALWAETANAYAFSPRSVELLTKEWGELVRRDRSHPSIVTWVPLNESWGVQHGAHDVRQQHYGLGLAHLTRALDRTRPVVSNDGWEHTDSDIWSVHDYAERGEELRARYGTPEAVQLLLDGMGPAGRQVRLTAAARPVDRGQPLMLTEFGGVSYAGGRADSWGYSTATDDADFEARVGDLLDAVRDCHPIAGYCWTQLTDTGQETNGLLRADRSPKLALDVLRRLVVGH